MRIGDAEATVSARGAELQSLRLRGRDLLWDGGSLWPRQAPLLFPVVGRLWDDALRSAGARHPMPRHGFARDRDFTGQARSATACAARLTQDEASLAAYPFPFALRVAYALAPGALRMDLSLHNPGGAPLPASLGLHPAFRWPLVPGAPKAAHRLVFDAEEPGAVHRLTPEGWLDPAPRPTPIQGRTLPLAEQLFAGDALVFLAPCSRALRFEVEGGPALRLRWEGFPHLGIWAKPDPGPAFLCLEPWEGHADPAGWTGDFTDKPGSFRLAPGATRRWTLAITLDG